uniref:CSON005245 protein n=1 Tax=Culicoides sonorensis TaxID=179676 RepID=A0A336MQ39_CULSO
MGNSLKMKKHDRPKELVIDNNDLKQAKQMWYKKVQYDMYKQELIDLKKCGYVKTSSPLYQLSPFINDEGIICMKGRIPNYNPIILSQKHKFTHLLINQYHIENLHIGVDEVISNLRENFWIPSCRMLVRSVFKNCLKCKLRKPKIEPVIMGDIPKIRSERCIYPFTYTGIDFFGPMMIKQGRTYVKNWGSLFTCMTTRGIHIELYYLLHCLRLLILPLTYVSCDKDDLKPISPNDIILLRKNQSQFDIKMEYNYSPKQTWKFAHKIADEFWSRWMKEYRPTLLKRNKWHDNKKNPNFQVGDLVLVLDDNMIRGKYLRGIVEKVFPDKNGNVRVASIKTSTGILKRPIVKLAKIQISQGLEDVIV